MTAPAYRSSSRAPYVIAAVVVVSLMVSAISVGCSSGSSGTSPALTSTVAQGWAPSATVKDPSIPGIGATRDDWNASHVPNPGFNNGAVYGYDPSLPDYLSANHSVYWGVSDNSDGGMIPPTGNRIQAYMLNIHPVDRDEALARVRQELPSDATVGSDLTQDKCYLVAFESPTLKAATQDKGAVVELLEVQEGGTYAPSPQRFNQVHISLSYDGSILPGLDC
jgi:hypothetical protein